MTSAPTTDPAESGATGPVEERPGPHAPAPAQPTAREPDARAAAGPGPGGRARQAAKRCARAATRATVAVAARMLGALWRAARAHPAPALGTGLAGLAVIVLLQAPNANGFYTTGLYRAGDQLAELECLALNIYHEARGEPRYGKFAVGHVVINRMHDPRFPDTVCDVVKQGGEAPLHACQFSWWCDGKSDRPRDAVAWRESKTLASLVYSGRVKDPTQGALWYHADFVDPAWRSSLTAGDKIGRHIFYHRN